MELRSQLAFLRSSLPLILACTLISAVAALAISLATPAVYESKVLLLVGESLTPGANSLNDLLFSQRLSQTYATLAVTDPVARSVIDQLKLQTTPEELLAKVQAEAGLDSTLLTITVQDEDPAMAAAIANAFGARLATTTASGTNVYEDMQSFVQQDMVSVRAQIESVQAQIDRLTAIKDPTAAQSNQLNALEVQIASLRSTFATLLSFSSGAPANRVSVADPASVSDKPVSPKVAINTLLGAALGAVIGVALAYTRRRLDDTVRLPEELEALTGKPFLGVVVKMPGDKRRPIYYRLATLLYPRSPAAEGFRHIRTAIEFASTGAPIRSLLVTSAMPRDGKTTLAANLAVAFAQAGRSVCLVDADLRQPQVHSFFGLTNAVGLSDLLKSEGMTFNSVTSPTEVENLRVLTSGPVPGNPAELVASARMRAVVDSLLLNVDMIIMDSPPLQAVTDAAILASVADGTVLVAAAGRTRRASLMRARDTLLRVGARVLGTALNAVDERVGADAAFGYFSYYGIPDQQVDGAGPPTSGGSGTGTPSVNANPRRPLSPSVRADVTGSSDR